MKLIFEVFIALSVSGTICAWPTTRTSCTKYHCENGKCIGNHCVCNEDYELINETDKYVYETINKCKPKCNSENCLGECATPGVCRCDFDKFFESNSTIINRMCEPECPESCKSSKGFCRVTNVCSCQTGFKLKEPERDSCVPACHGDCNNNGICKKPYECECNEGYAIKILTFNFDNDIMNTTCVPVCDNGCVNGRCLSPGQCVCNAGFVKDIKGVCQFCPKNCLHGVCDPSTLQCNCDFGYCGKSCEKLSVCAVYLSRTTNSLVE